jgi:hypothetical protein
MADDAAPIEHPAMQLARLRQKAEAGLDRILAIAEEILAVIDSLGPDPDAEPSLGLLESTGGNPYAPGYGDQSRIAEGATDDREEDRSDQEHNIGWESHGAQSRLDAGTDDREPALGWPERLDQSRDRRSRAEFEDEPTMGATIVCGDQTRWAQAYDANDSEREDVSEDEGAQCEDEGAETGDDEPLLGFHETPAGTSQFAAVVVSSDEQEPSLGSTDNLDQRRWADHFAPRATHASFDYEEQCEDEGMMDNEDAEHGGRVPENEE